MWMNIYKYLQISTNIYKYTFIYIYIHLYTFIYIYIHLYTFIYIYIIIIIIVIVIIVIINVSRGNRHETNLKSLPISGNNYIYIHIYMMRSWSYHLIGWDIMSPGSPKGHTGAALYRSAGIVNISNTKIYQVPELHCFGVPGMTHHESLNHVWNHPPVMWAGARSIQRKPL